MEDGRMRREDERTRGPSLDPRKCGTKEKEEE
jgi:hypothetical protein